MLNSMPSAAASTNNAALAEAVSTLSVCSASPQQDAEWLLADLLDCRPADLRVINALATDIQMQFKHRIQRRVAGETVAAILGEWEFWSLKLKVTADVLVPRADSERLVEIALEKINHIEQPSVLDLGTGTGCIALALASERPDATITAIEHSQAALAVATANRDALKLNVELRLSNWFENVNGRYDLIVSNPPYIEAGDPHLQQLQGEPMSALVSGADGLDDIRQIIKGAPAFLQAHGHLLLEHGHDQAAAVRALFTPDYEAIQTWQDYGGKDRVTGGLLGGQP